MKKRLLSLGLVAALCLSLLPMAAFAADGVSYIDASGQAKTQATATEVTTSTTTWGTSGTESWYVVSGSVTIALKDSTGYYAAPITVAGNVNLILADSCTLTTTSIEISGGSSLTIYGQSGNTGKLVLNSQAANNYGCILGGATLAVYGGEVESIYSSTASAYGLSCDNVTIAGNAKVTFDVTTTGSSNYLAQAIIAKNSFTIGGNATVTATATAPTSARGVIGESSSTITIGGSANVTITSKNDNNDVVGIEFYSGATLNVTDQAIVKVNATSTSGSAAAFDEPGQVTVGNEATLIQTTTANGATTQTVNLGPFKVEGGTYGTDYAYSNGVLEIKTDKALTISAGNATWGDAVSGRIVVPAGVTANLTFNGVHLKSDTDPALDVSGTANVTIATWSKFTGGIKIAGALAIAANVDLDCDSITFSGNGSLSVSDTSSGRISVTGNLGDSTNPGSVTVTNGTLYVEGNIYTNSFAVNGGEVTAFGYDGTEYTISTTNFTIDRGGVVTTNTLNISGTPTYTHGIVYADNIYTVYGDMTVDKLIPGTSKYIYEGEMLIIPGGASLALEGNTLSNYGTILVAGDSSLTNGSLTQYGDGYYIPTITVDDLYYTGSALTPTVTYPENITILGTSFAPYTDWGESTYTYPNGQTEIKNVGDYTVSYTKFGITLTDTFSVLQSSTTFDGGVQTYNGTTPTDTFTYGDTITVKVTPEATGQAAKTRTLTAPTTNQMAIFNGETQLTEPQTVTNGQELTFDVTGLGAGSYTLTANYVGNDNMASYSQAFAVTVNKATPTVSGVTKTEPGAIYPTTVLDSIKLTATTSVEGALSLDANQTLAVGTKAYNWTFTPTDTTNYETVTGTVSLTVAEDTLESIAVTTAPGKTTYTYGETFDKTGMVVTATYASGRTAEVTDVTITPDTLTVETSELTITYQGKTVVQAVTVNPKVVTEPTITVEPESYTYTGQAITPTKVVVRDGETVVPESEYTVAYSNNVNVGDATVTITDVTGGNYVVSGSATFAIAARPSSGGGGSSGTTVTEKNPDGSTTTTTTDRVTGAVTEVTKQPDGSATTVETKKDGTVTAETTVSDKAGAALVAEAKESGAEQVVIAPAIPEGASQTEVSISADTVGAIGRETAASLTVSTPVADVNIPNGGLAELAHAGGTVTVGVAQSGSTVELTVTAGGKDVAELPGGITMTVPHEDAVPGTVAVLVKEDGSREVIRKSVSGENQVTIPLAGSATVELVDNSKDFDDTAGHWAGDPIDFVTARELYQGTGPKTFTPDGSMTRAMLARLLHNLESNPDHAFDGAFSDLDDHWAADSIHWAAEQGIVGGYPDGSYRADEAISREQLAVMLWRYAGCPESSQTVDHFADAGNVSGYAKAALGWASQEGILTGKGGGVLDPLGEATRAEVAAMLMRMLAD